MLCGPRQKPEQQRQPQHGIQRRPGQDADLRHKQQALAERQPRNEERHSKANTSQNSTRGQNRPRYPFGELRQPRAHGEPTEQGDANGLPNSQPNHNGHSHGIRESPGLDRHARIGEGEQRHNHKTDPTGAERLPTAPGARWLLAPPALPTAGRSDVCAYRATILFGEILRDGSGGRLTTPLPSPQETPALPPALSD